MQFPPITAPKVENHPDNVKKRKIAPIESQQEPIATKTQDEIPKIEPERPEFSEKEEHLTSLENSHDSKRWEDSRRKDSLREEWKIGPVASQQEPKARKTQDGIPKIELERPEFEKKENHFTGSENSHDNNKEWGGSRRKDSLSEFDIDDYEELDINNDEEEDELETKRNQKHVERLKGQKTENKNYEEPKISLAQSLCMCLFTYDD